MYEACIIRTLSTIFGCFVATTKIQTCQDVAHFGFDLSLYAHVVFSFGNVSDCLVSCHTRWNPSIPLRHPLLISHDRSLLSGPDGALYTDFPQTSGLSRTFLVYWMFYIFPEETWNVIQPQEMYFRQRETLHFEGFSYIAVTECNKRKEIPVLHLMIDVYF